MIGETDMWREKQEDVVLNVNVKYLYCSTQNRERKIFLGYIVLPVGPT